MPVDVLTRLRTETRSSHQALEADLDIFSHLASDAGRRRLVGLFHGLHAGAEAALGPWLSALPDLDYDARRRQPLLDRDLAWFGDRAPAACPMPDPASEGEALGLLYVLEGSTLGGQVIRKRLLADGRTLDGVSFLDPYGDQTGPRWKGFLAVLGRACPPDRPATGQAAVRGAVRGFIAARNWLCAPVRQEACA
ncbi:MAG: biliverdin-producing heme oxygenase [Caulobacter sp.]|nr:biliverdin-producing heme oxygenase [Caulobacter sp.]